jgi:hypothetical protein
MKLLPLLLRVLVVHLLHWPTSHSLCHHVLCGQA